MMRTLATLLTLSGLYGAIAPAAAAEAIAGKYCGTAWSGGELVEVITTLSTDANGLLVGSYEFADKGQNTPGTLREYLKEDENRRTLVWVDKYGAGQLVVTFDRSRDSFSGGWNGEIDPPAHRWDGQRCNLVASS
jgi:hypothetical protein